MPQAGRVPADPSAFDAVALWVVRHGQATGAASREVCFAEDSAPARPPDEVCDVAFPSAQIRICRPSGHSQRTQKMPGPKSNATA
jgi:hypothetical protein